MFEDKKQGVRDVFNVHAVQASVSGKGHRSAHVLMGHLYPSGEVNVTRMAIDIGQAKDGATWAGQDRIFGQRVIDRGWLIRC